MVIQPLPAIEAEPQPHGKRLIGSSGEGPVLVALHLLHRLRAQQPDALKTTVSRQQGRHLRHIHGAGGEASGKVPSRGSREVPVSDAAQAGGGTAQGVGPVQRGDQLRLMEFSGGEGAIRPHRGQHPLRQYVVQIAACRQLQRLAQDAEGVVVVAPIPQVPRRAPAVAGGAAQLGLHPLIVPGDALAVQQG